jgi:hypothetical protein
MLYLLTPTPDDKIQERRELARLRRQARKRGFRVLKDWSNTWSLVDARIAPPRALIGLAQVPLAMIEVELNHPLPPRRRRAPVVSSDRIALVEGGAS